MNRAVRARPALTLTVVAATVASVALAAPAAAERHRPRPTVSSVDHNGFASGATTGGARVTITGKHFAAVKAVRFGKRAGSHITVLSSHRLKVTAPAHAIGEVHVRVITKAGESTVSSHNAFDFQAHRLIDGGDDHSCQALTSTRTASCWGSNSNGQLGDGTTASSDEPEAVSGLSDVVSIAAGDDFSCALRASGTVLCWGNNTDGQLGNGTITSSLTPTKVLGLGGRALDIAAGGAQSCAVVVGTTVRCWGYNDDGQLGDTTTTNRSRPVTVHKLTSVVAVSAGEVATCAARTDGRAYCWGSNGHGQLGTGTTISSSTKPVRVVGVDSAVDSTSGQAGSCVLTRAGRIQCWGQGTEGELGNGASTDSNRPVTVAGISGATSVALGGFHACAVVQAAVECWGFNMEGQLGNGTNTDAAAPVTLALTGVTAVGVGLYHSLAVGSNGTAEAWGGNSAGELGNGTMTDSNVPVAVV